MTHLVTLAFRPSSFMVLELISAVHCCPNVLIHPALILYYNIWKAFRLKAYSKTHVLQLNSSKFKEASLPEAGSTRFDSTVQKVLREPLILTKITMPTFHPLLQTTALCCVRNSKHNSCGCFMQNFMSSKYVN